MNFLLPLASLFGVEVDHITDRIKQTLLVNFAIGSFALVGVIFLIFAGFLALAAEIGGIYAALLIAGLFLLLALLVYLVARIGERRRKREIMEKRRSSETSAFVTSATLTALPMLLKSPLLRTIGIPAAAVAAFMLIRNSSDRDQD